MQGCRLGQPERQPQPFHELFHQAAVQWPTAAAEEQWVMLAGQAARYSAKVDAAYRLGDLFEERRRLVQDWARFCEFPTAGGLTWLSGKGAFLASMPARMTVTSGGWDSPNITAV
jgi:hypothetical protein